MFNIFFINVEYDELTIIFGYLKILLKTKSRVSTTEAYRQTCFTKEEHDFGQRKYSVYAYLKRSLLEEIPSLFINKLSFAAV